MNKKKKTSTKNDSKLINTLIIIGIVFLIGSLIIMFANNSQTDNYIKEITYQEYEEIIKEDKYSIILLTSPTCSHCVSYKPFVNYVAKENNLNVYNINLTTITYEEYVSLHDKYSATKNEYREGQAVIPTPATLVVRNNLEITSTLGDIGYNGLTQLLKNNNVIK